jgi:shikimate kinase
MVWFFGMPTAGKSWSADFCAKYNDWIHVDGDEVLMRQDPETVDIWKTFFTYYEDIIANKEPNTEKIEPYLTHLVN